MNSKKANACDYRTQNVAEIGAVNVKQLSIVTNKTVKISILILNCLRACIFAINFLLNISIPKHPKLPISFIVIANEYVTDRCHIHDINSIDCGGG